MRLTAFPGRAPVWTVLLAPGPSWVPVRARELTPSVKEEPRLSSVVCGDPVAEDQPEPPLDSGCGRDSSSARGCVLGSPRGASWWRRGQGDIPEVGVSRDAWGNLDFCCP